jgi:hypothetical protein
MAKPIRQKVFRSLPFFAVASLVLFLLLAAQSPRSAEAHGERAPNVAIFAGWGVSLACVDLYDNPFGYYKIYKVYPSANYRVWDSLAGDWYWHTHEVYWGEGGQIVGDYAIGWYYDCGFLFP